MKATKDGYTVGIASEPFDDAQCQSSNDPPAGPLRSEASEARPDGGKCQINDQNPNVKIGRILVFVNLGYSKLDHVESEIALHGLTSFFEYLTIRK